MRLHRINGICERRYHPQSFQRCQNVQILECHGKKSLRLEIVIVCLNQVLRIYIMTSVPIVQIYERISENE
jgi:hypothetical protein